MQVRLLVRTEDNAQRERVVGLLQGFDAELAQVPLGSEQDFGPILFAMNKLYLCHEKQRLSAGFGFQPRLQGTGQPVLPAGWMLKNLAIATELEFAGQTTKDGTDGDTTRISVLAYYDW